MEVNFWRLKEDTKFIENKKKPLGTIDGYNKPDHIKN
jgi:hypothetical protein